MSVTFLARGLHGACAEIEAACMGLHGARTENEAACANEVCFARAPQKCREYEIMLLMLLM